MPSLLSLLLIPGSLLLLIKCYQSAPVAFWAIDIVYCHIISATCVSQVFMLSSNPFLCCFMNRIGEFSTSDMLVSNMELDVLRLCNLMLWLVKGGQPSYSVAWWLLINFSFQDANCCSNRAALITLILPRSNCSFDWFSISFPFLIF